MELTLTGSTLLIVKENGERELFFLKKINLKRKEAFYESFQLDSGVPLRYEKFQQISKFFFQLTSFLTGNASSELRQPQTSLNFFLLFI